MKNILARGGIEFLAVFLGLGLSFNVEEWREESQIRERLKGDYQSIQNDLEKDIPYLKQIIEEQIERNEAGIELIKMLDEEHLLDYEAFVTLNNLAISGNTFFGTKASYEASVSSGRLTYFGVDTLGNEIGKVFEHHFNRLDLNGQLLDEFSLFKMPNINRGDKYLSEKIKKQNLEIIQSPEYNPLLRRFNLLRGYFIKRAVSALEQMEKVNELLLKKLSENQ
jgi:hypothetical protein